MYIYCDTLVKNIKYMEKKEIESSTSLNQRKKGVSEKNR